MTYLNRKLFFAFTAFFLLGCALTQAAPDTGQVADQVATSVALTVAAIPKTATATNSPTPSPTKVIPPTLTPTLIPTIVPPTVTPTSLPVYACNIINQRPRDDSTFRPNQGFDIKWTIVNTGTKRWEEETYLAYQNGPEMTEIKSVLIPKLRPGQQYEVIIEATAPPETDRQVMVWAIVGPAENDGALQWMCYPYVRIIVEK